jgi:hypothetical protein
MGSLTAKPYGEYICVAFYPILKYCVDGPMMIVNEKNTSLFQNTRYFCLMA